MFIFTKLSAAMRPKILEKLRQLSKIAVSNASYLCFFEKLVSRDIHIELSTGQSNNRH